MLKKYSAGILYIILTILCGAFAIGSFISMNIYVGVLSSIITIICAVLSIMYLSLPSEIVVLMDNHNIAFPKGVCIPLESIVDVYCKQAWAKGIKYKFGRITICKASGSYQYHFASDCKEVAMQLIHLVETEKNKLE